MSLNELLDLAVILVPTITSVGGIITIAKVVLKKLGVNKDDVASVVKSTVEEIVEKIDTTDELKELITFVKMVHQENYILKERMEQMIEKGLIEEVVNPHENKNK